MPHNLRALLKSSNIPFTVIEFPAGDVLFRQGDACADAWCIESGRVRLSVTTPAGQEAIFGLLGAGSLLSEELLAGQRDFRHSAVAIEPTVVLRVSGDRMLTLLHTQGPLLDHVIGHLMAHHIDMENALIHQILYLAEERLAHRLMALAQCDGVADRCVLPHLSQEIIAEMVGTTRSRVNVFMRRFKEVGFLETSGGDVFVHPSRLYRAILHAPLPHTGDTRARAC